jgi:hypothetical protein
MENTMSDIPGKMKSLSLDDFIPSPKHTVFKRRQKKTIEAMKVSLETPAKKPDNRQSHYSKIHGKFQVFKILHGDDIILVVDCERCEQLDLQAVRLEGRRGNAIVRLRNIGTVEGVVRSDASVYRMDEQCIGLRRVNGNCKSTKENNES